MKDKKRGKTDLMSGPNGNDTDGVKKTLFIWNFLTVGFGATIGTGRVLLVGDRVVIRGGSIAAMIAFAIGAALLLPTGAVFGELTVVISIPGGIIEYVDKIYGRYALYITGWFLALGNGILCPWETIAISTLVSDMFGGLFPVLRAVKLYTIMGADVYLFPTVIVLGFTIYVVLLNFRGVSTTAKSQALLTKALLAGMLLAIAIPSVKGGPSNILPSSTQVEGPSMVIGADNMLAGIISVLAMTPPLYAEFDTIPQQAGEAMEGPDWNKLGRVISMALLAVGGLYMICIYSFGIIIPWTDFIKNTVPALACLESISIFLYVATLVIATSGPMGSMNSFHGTTSRIMLAAGRKGQLPDSFTALDEKNGAPKMANTVLVALTIMEPFLGKNMLVSLTNVSTLAFILSYTMVSFICLKVRYMELDLLRPYKVPGGKAGICMACLADTIIIELMAIPFSPAALKPVEWVIVVVWLVIGLGLSVVTRAKGNNKAAVAAK